jgi:transcriptional regulator with XRE-family HTH domain
MVSTLKTLRKSLGLTQKEFAEKTGFSQSALSMIEAGQWPLTEKNIRLICVMFNVNERWLRTGEGEMFAEGSPYTQELLEVFSTLSPAGQEFVLDMARKLLNLQES